MAGSACTITENGHSRPVRKIHFDWTSDDATGEVTSGLTSDVYDGQIVRMLAVPGSGGTQPSNNWLYNVEDEYGIDLTGGSITNSNATNTWVSAAGSTNFVPRSRLRVVVTGAGNSKTGRITLWVR